MIAIEKCRNRPSRSSLELEIEVERETAKMFELSYFSPFSSYRGNMNIFTDGSFRSVESQYHVTEIEVNLTQSPYLRYSVRY